MVLSRQYLQGMEINWFVFVGSRKTYVTFIFLALRPLTDTCCSGLGEERARAVDPEARASSRTNRRGIPLLNSGAIVPVNALTCLALPCHGHIVRVTPRQTGDRALGAAPLGPASLRRRDCIKCLTYLMK